MKNLEQTKVVYEIKEERFRDAVSMLLGINNDEYLEKRVTNNPDLRKKLDDCGVLNIWFTKKELLKTNYDIALEQIKIQEEIQSAGFNIVTCGNCGNTMLHRINDEHLDCFCGRRMDLSDCPDLWYSGVENNEEFQEAVTEVPKDTNSETIIFSDGYGFLDVTDKAKEIFNSGLFSLYEVRVNDQAESLIEDWETLNECLEKGAVIGIELGFIK